MSVAACIIDLRANGQIDAARAQLFLDVFTDLERSYGSSMGQAARVAAASEETMKVLAGELARKKRQTVLQVTAQRQVLANVQRLADAAVPMDVAMLAHFDVAEQARNVTNVPLQSKVIRGQAWAKMADFALRYERGMFTQVKHVNEVLQLVPALFGRPTGNPAVDGIAKQLTAGFEHLRQRYNMAGGNIGKRNDWGLPQKHDADLIKAATYPVWRQAVLDGIDMQEMVDFDSGRPFTGERLELALDKMFKSITTRGWDDRKPGSAAGTKLANQRAEARFLVFKGPDEWLAYQRRFGALAGSSDRTVASNLLDLIIGHVEDMADDIAAMEVLGPNPDATVRWMGDVLLKAEAQGVIEDGRIFSSATVAKRAAGKIRLLWEHQRGALSVPESEGLARFGSEVRSSQVASKLGSAFLSAMPDMWASAMTRMYNDMPVWQVFSDYLLGMAPLVKAGDKARAVRAGLIADEMLSYLGSMHRISSEISQSGLFARAAGTVINLSLLSRFTRVGKMGFGLSFLENLADDAGKAWDALSPRVRNRLEAHGIGSDRWDMMRKVGRDPKSGLIRFDLLAEAEGLPPGAGQDLADRLMRATLAETQMAVAEVGPTMRAKMTAGTQAGTVAGEVVRTGGQFLGFPLQFFHQHMDRALHGGMMNPAKYAVSLFLGATVLGAVVIQLRQLANGKDPLDTDDPKFWMAAAAQGGGAGIVGDLLFSDYSRTGGGLTSVLMGPTFGQVDQLANLTIGNAQSVLGGDDTNIGREAVRFARANTPGSNLWYTRLATDRLIWETLQRWADPDFEQAMQRMEQRAKREFGQDYYWEPGEYAPDRAPEFGFEESEQ